MAGFGDEQRFLQHSNLIVQFVRDTRLATYLTPSVITGGVYTDIQRLYLTDPKKATETLIDAILQSQEPGKWPSLKHALHQADYPYLVKLLDGDIVHQERETKIMELFGPDLQENINPNEIAVQLLSERVINNGDKEQILARNASHGPMSASVVLLDCIKIRLPPKEWYPKFLRALINNGQRFLVEKIDPDFGDCYKDYSSANTSQDGASCSYMMETESSTSMSSATSFTSYGPSSVREHVMEDYVQPEESINNLSPAPPASAVYRQYSETYASTGAISSGSMRKVDHDSITYVKSDDNLDTAEKKKVEKILNIPVKQELVESEQPQKITKDDLADLKKEDESNDDTDDSINSDYGDEEEVPIKGPLKLRKFQLELAERALRGENTIVYSETGTGKTYVALYVIKEHLRKKKAEGECPKVVFLARTGALVVQQTGRLERYLPEYKVQKLTGDHERSMMMGHMLPYADIFCLTPQILVNNLTEGIIKSLSAFSLLVFDECHHTMKDEPYNRLMRLYLLEKFDHQATERNNLPQVVGLTASVGVGKARTESDAVEHILKLCANLDVRDISVVEREREEVEQYISKPREETIPMKTQKSDMGRKILLLAIRETEEKLEDFVVIEPDLIDEWNKLPQDKESKQYFTWLITSEKAAQNVVHDAEQCRNIVSCMRYLSVYCAALEVNTLLRIRDVSKFLATRFQKDGTQKDVLNETEKELYKYFQDVQKKLLKDARTVENPNVKLIQETLGSLFEEKGPDSRAMIFVQARATCKALASSLDADLKQHGMTVRPLFGKELRGEEQGMTESEQNDTVEKFRKGTYNILVATSVGGEGIDIPDCNIVLSYNYTGNEITKIQMSGRIRKSSDGANIILGSDTVIRQEQLNVYKVAMMYKAMEEIKQMHQRMKHERIRAIQESAVRTEKMRQELQKHKDKRKSNDGCYQFQCGRCKTHACFNTDIRKLKTHHFVVDKEFANKIRLKPHRSPKKIDGFDKNFKMYCKECPNDWGVIFEREGMPCRTLKLESFMVVNKTTGESRRYKKWLDVPFQPEKVEFEDITRLLGETFQCQKRKSTSPPPMAPVSNVQKRSHSDSCKETFSSAANEDENCQTESVVMATQSASLVSMRQPTDTESDSETDKGRITGTERDVSPGEMRPRAVSDGNKDQQEETHIQIKGSLKIFKLQRLSSVRETPVYKGEFEDIPVAVKQLPKAGQSVVQYHDGYERQLKQVETLRETSKLNMQNVIRFLKSEESVRSLYIAFELCNGTLWDYVQDVDQWQEHIGCKEVLRQMANGLACLHHPEVKIVHRDLKPSNILIRKTVTSAFAVIADFGCAKFLKGDSCTMTGNTGSQGWMAPEIYRSERDQGLDEKVTYTEACDIFSLGCLFYHVISTGKHPFGMTGSTQQTNINIGTVADMSSVPDHLAYIIPLIAQMISSNPEDRPTADDIREHPAVLNDEKIMDFFHKANNRIDTYTDAKKRRILEEGSDVIPAPNTSWLQVLPQYTQDYLTTCTYKAGVNSEYKVHEEKVRYLLKAVRNCEEHFKDLLPQVQMDIGMSVSDRVCFWLKRDRFPNLLSHIYIKLKGDGDFMNRWRDTVK